MAKYKLTNKAVDDLTRIWNYTFDKWSEYKADTYYLMLLENCNEVEITRILHEQMDLKNRVIEK
jgi:toxin ParE1/3/4